MKTKYVRRIIYIAAFGLALLANKPSSATPLYAVGQVVENTKAMRPVKNARVAVYFTTSPEEGELRYPEADSDMPFLEDLTNSRGFFLIKATPSPEDANVYTEAHFLVFPGTNPLTGHRYKAMKQDALADFQIDPIEVLKVAGFGEKSLQDIILELLSKAADVEIPIILSKDLVAEVAVAKIKVNVIPEPYALPIFVMACGLMFALLRGLKTRAFRE